MIKQPDDNPKHGTVRPIPTPKGMYRDRSMDLPCGIPPDKWTHCRQHPTQCYHAEYCPVNLECSSQRMVDHWHTLRKSPKGTMARLYPWRVPPPVEAATCGLNGCHGETQQTGPPRFCNQHVVYIDPVTKKGYCHYHKPGKES